MKPRVHFHSDNATFAGCEQMLVVLFTEALRTGEIDVSYSYRATPEYESGLAERIPPEIDRVGLDLPDSEGLMKALKRRYPSRSARPLRGLLHLLTAVLPIRQLFQLYDVVVLRRLLAERRPDILHINNGGFPGAGSCSAAAIAGRSVGIERIVYVVNSRAYGYGMPQRWFDYPIDRMTSASVSRFVTGSMSASRRLQGVLRLPPEKALVIPNGIAERPIDETPKQTRARLGIGTDEVLVTCVGSLTAGKGHRFAVEAFGAVVSRDPGRRAKLVIVGEGPEGARLERLIRQLGLRGQVRIIPRERNIWNLYAASDLVVLPSVSLEDFPNVVLEAMACSKPVIASAISGVPEQVVDGETGLLVPPGDLEELARAMRILFDFKELRERFGAAGRRRFEENFTAEKAARRYFDLYRSLLGD